MNPRLQLILRLNALSCLIFGVLFVAMPGPTGQFLDDASSSVIFWLGIALILHAGHLLLGSRRHEFRKVEVGYFILGDALWVIGSGILILAGTIHSVSAILAVVAVALMVGTLGFLQACTGGFLPGKIKAQA